MHPPPVKLGVAAYRRVSTNQQDSSLITQETRINQYADFKFSAAGFAFPGIPKEIDFSDPDTSGSKPFADRSGSRTFLNTLRFGTIQHLIVAKLDRLGRDAGDVWNTFKLLQEHGVTLHIVDMNGDSMSTNGPMGKFMFQMMAAFAEFELATIRQRIQDKMNLKFQQHELCGTVPYGYDAVPTGKFVTKNKITREIRDLVPNEKEQQIIRLMAAWQAAGHTTYRIAAELNARGIPTKRGAGQPLKYKGREIRSSGQWQVGNVTKVLASKHTARILNPAQPQPAALDAAA